MIGKTVYWQDAAPAQLVLITGSESYLASKAMSRIKQILRAESPELEITEIDDGEYSPSLLFSVAAPSLFAEPRLVIIQGAQESLLEDLTKLTEEPIEACTVVVRVPNSVGHNQKLKQSLSKKALVVSCEELKKDSERADFVKQELANSGKKIDASGLKALLAAFNQDLAELGGACAQLAAAAESTITQEVVERNFQGRVETNAFKIADAALAGNAAEAIRLFRHGFTTGIDPVALNAALAMRIRQLARLYNDRNASPAALGMQPWQLDKARRELQGWDESALVSLVQLAAQTDADVKGASRDPEFSIERLLMAMARK
ncbi:MAG: polymerase subunit delta [Actinomycetota bacterium]